MLRISHASRSENGAVAILAALVALVLIGISAFAVDLGNAFSRKRDVQTQADFAALAGADKLGDANSKVATDFAVVAVAEYLTKNKPQDDSVGVTPDVTPDQLVDGDDINGEVYFTGHRMRVITPRANVQYGLAGVLGFSDIDVQAEASVKINSGGAVLPFFAVDGCDYGPQTISTPPPGPATGLNLAAVTETPTITLDPFTSSTPDQMDADPTPSSAMTITGAGFNDVTKIGFFRNDGTTIVDVAVTPLDDNNIVLSAGSIPSSVTSVEEVWYVRAFKGATNKWSKEDNAQPLRIGAAVMECVGAMSSGNFGSLSVPRADSNNATADGWLPINVAEGLQDPLTLSVHSAASAAENWNCTEPLAGAVVSDSGTDLQPGTNCLATNTGLPDTSATTGFVTGGSNGAKVFSGRLDADTTPGCGAQSSDRNGRWGTGIYKMPGHVEYMVNDDLLTCFLDTGVTINDISQDTYSGPAVLDEDIYRSPRFFLQPVLGRKPFPGASEKYSIVDFRPAFLTDQPASAVGGSMTLGSSTDHNGLSVAGGKVSKVKVVFFNINALPPPPDDAPLTDYIGAGPKIITLVD